MSFLKNQKVLIFIALLTLILLSSFKFVDENEVIGLKHPESVYPYEGYIYVSNIGSSPISPNKDGFVTKLDKYGNILEYKFIEGLEAPKGIYPYHNKLYIADLTRVCVADLNSGKLIKCIEIKGSRFLNDIIVKNGEIFVTDTWNNCVYKIDKNGRVSIFFSTESMSPNGIDFSDKLNAFIVVSFSKPEVYIISLKGKLLRKFHLSGLTGFDGVVVRGKRVYMSDYRTGKIVETNLEFKKYRVLMDLHTPEADIFVKGSKIYLPLIEKNRLLIGKLQ